MAPDKAENHQRWAELGKDERQRERERENEREDTRGKRDESKG